MIKIENVDIVGFEPAIRGMRNPMNSWDRTDSEFDKNYGFGVKFIGEHDFQLMHNLAKAGPVHAKYKRMICVYMDITAPLYWWKEFDTYKVGTVANSCSTMHKIHAKEFTIDDFSHDHLLTEGVDHISGLEALYTLMVVLNNYRKLFIETGDKTYWWQMIQLLPASYNQRRTVMLNYEVLANIYPNRKDHKLDEWRDFCKWIEQLPMSSIITLDIMDEKENVK